MDYFNNINLFNIKNFQSKFITFILIMFLVLTYGLIDVNAKEINVNGYYGLINCTEVVSNNTSSVVDCSYVNSETINGSNTVYTKLPKAVSDFSGTTSNYTISNSLFLFGYYNFTKDNYYTLNFEYDNGSFIDNNLNLTSVSDVSYGYFGSSDYIENQGLSDLSYSATFDSNTFKGYISITFKCTNDTSSYRFKITRNPILRNYSFQYDQFFRVFLLNAIEEQDNSSALLGQITNQNNTMINQNQQIINNGNQINDNLTNDNVDESTDKATDFFNNFDSGDSGTLTDIISLPLDFLDNLNNTCSPIVLPVPYMGDITLPCLQSYLSTFIPETFINLIRLIVNGFLMYKIITSLIDFLNSLKDPNNFDLEVMDL